MATQSPFSLVSDAITQFAAQTQPPAWLIDETLNRVVLFLNHVISQEPEAQNRLARQKGRCIQLQWQDKLIQVSPSAVGLLQRVSGQSTDLKLTLTDASPIAMAAAVLKGEKPGVHIEGDVQLAAEINWLIDHVRWDAAEDLSGLIGDAAAHTVVSMGQQAIQALRQFARRAAPGADLHKAAP